MFSSSSIPDEWQVSRYSLGFCLIHTVVALALPNVVAFDLAIPAEIFGSRSERERYQFMVCTPVPGPVPSSTGFAVQADHDLAALATADPVVVPGYWPPQHPGEPVVTALRPRPLAEHEWSRCAPGRSRSPRPGCSTAGGRPPTGATPPTSPPGSTCLHLVRTDHGAEAAVQIARRLVVAPNRDGGQAQWLQRPLPPPGEGLAGTCAWALHHLAQPLTVADLAEHAGWAPRTLARRFLHETGLTPLRWLTAQRLLDARRLLETTDRPVDDIAARSGLGSAANLRLHLARDAGTTPTAYRAAYQGHP